MNFFKNLKIRTKIISSFCIVVVITGMVGYVGISNIKKIAALDNELYTNNTKPIALLNIVQVGLQMNRVTVRNMIIENDENKNKDNKNSVVKKDQEIDKAMVDLNSTNKSKEVIDEYNNLKVYIEKYRPVRDKIIDLAAQNKNDEAIALMNGEGATLAKSMDDSIIKLVNLKETQAKDKADNNTRTATDATNSMLLIISIGILIALALGFIISGLISKPIKKVLHMIEEMSKGHLSERLNIKTKDEVGQMSIELDIFTNALQTQVVGVMNKISEGDISMDIPLQDEKDEIAPAMIKMTKNIRALVSDANMLSKAAVEGKLDTRADATKHSGDYRKIVEGVNNTLDSVIGPLNVASEYVDRISKGDMPSKITDTYQGDFNAIKNNLNNCIDNINLLVADANMLSKAAVEGKLDTRADATKHSGDYRKIVEGVNNTLDSIMKPLNEGIEILGEMAVNNFGSTMEGNYNGLMKTFEYSINQILERLRALENVFVMLSKGDTSKVEAYKQVGRRSEQDKIMPAVIASMTSIQNLINESNKISESAINGDLSIKGNVNGYEGGYKEIISGMNNTLAAVNKPLKETLDILQKMAQGDLTTSVEEEYKGAYDDIKQAINTTVSSLNDILGEINNASEQVATGSNQVSDGSQALSQGATEQASSIEELTSSITEVAAQTKENASNANKANELALNVKENAEEGNKHMGEMLKAMGEINESSANISKIIKVIDEIAFQTNILALNAAVEAARAGQHGKGFAVVAEEVRNLAARSANAAKETTALIEGSIKKAEKGTEIANYTAKALDEIVNGVSKAATLIAEIAASSNEQATGISQINSGIEQLSQVVQTNSATAEESAAASEELSSQAQLLKNMVEKFELKNSNTSSFKNEQADYKKKSAYGSKKSSSFKEAAATSSKPKIALSDKEFGKY